MSASGSMKRADQSKMTSKWINAMSVLFGAQLSMSWF